MFEESAWIWLVLACLIVVGIKISRVIKREKAVAEHYKSTAESLHREIKRLVEVSGAIEEMRRQLDGQKIHCIGDEDA